MPQIFKVPTSAPVDFVTNDNGTFSDSIQFDPKGPTGATAGAWGFTGVSFRMDIKRDLNATGPLMTLGLGATGINIQDTTFRIIAFSVPEANIQACLLPGQYVYDFIMIDGSTPQVRTPLMHGKFVVKHGVTGG
jgi:hypothetical protein